MKIDYSPMFALMKEKGITTYKLINNYGISRAMIDKLKHNRNVNVQTLLTFCMILDCQIGDLVQCVDDTE